jgi:hypothetical protein
VSAFHATAPKSWVETGGSNASFREFARDDTSLALMRVDEKERVIFDLGKMTVRGAQDIQKTILPSGEEALSSVSPLSGLITEKSADTCEAQPSGTCTCDLRWLRPLQGAVGLGEVAKKVKDISDDLAKERRDLANDPIKVVQGPGSDLFVVDHHHGALAWLKAGYTAGSCQFLDVKLPSEPDAFFAAADGQKLARLKDENGATIAPDRLPKTLGAEPDDPYRTLAWLVRKADGFCRALMDPAPPFAEFAWADWLRPRLDAPPVAAATDPGLWAPGVKKRDREAKQAGVLNVALQGASSDAAGPSGANLPGWNGARKLTGDACNPKDTE